MTAERKTKSSSTLIDVKEVFALFHEMNRDFDSQTYWVAPSYVYDNRTVGYVCLWKQR